MILSFCDGRTTIGHQGPGVEGFGLVMFEMIGVGLGGVANVNGFLGSQVDLPVDVGRLMGGLADALGGM